MAHATATFDRPFSVADHQQMQAEGWCISNDSDGNDQIQRIDELAIFPSDQAAVASVVDAARHGSDLHRRALAYIIAPPNAQGRTYPIFLTADELLHASANISPALYRAERHQEIRPQAYATLKSLADKVGEQMEAAQHDPTLTD